jgi:hypothetical protein
MKLSKKSKQLITFLSKHKLLNYEKINNKTEVILKQLHISLFEAHNYVRRKNFRKHMVVRKISNVSQIPKPLLFNASSFPEKVRKHIDESMVTEITYTFSINNRNAKVHFVLEHELSDHLISLFNKYIDSIAMWLYILNIYSSKECVNNITIYLYFTSLEKHLPESNIHILDENHVNTAFTTTCPKESEIVIFRKEEWFKVFIHETFHNFGLDFSGMNSRYINDCLLNIFKVNSEVNAYEAYTEFWAEIMNAAFCAFFSLKTKNLASEFYSSFEVFVNFERAYSFFQLEKTLHFMGLTYHDLYSKTRNSSIIRENMYKEKSNVLSYYVIKTILLNKYQGFLGWCEKNNFNLLDFKKTPANLKEFCKFIERNYKTCSMLDGIDNTHEFYINVKKHHYYNKTKTTDSDNQSLDYILSNMRMSICELG